MSIRQARLADAVVLQDLSAVLGYGYPLEKLTANLANSLADDKQIILVACLEEEVIGYCHAEYYEPLYADCMLNVLALVVLEAYQGQGIGAQLLLALESAALDRGIVDIRINSGEKRHVAHLFYEKNGYVCSKSQKNFLKRLK